jgi:hypothetical protein
MLAACCVAASHAQQRWYLFMHDDGCVPVRTLAPSLPALRLAATPAEILAAVRQQDGGATMQPFAREAKGWGPALTESNAYVIRGPRMDAGITLFDERLCAALGALRQ